MTEEQWLSCADPVPMVEFLRTNGTASRRKLRLWMVACCRPVWPLLTDERSRKAVEVAERFADGLAGEDELYDAEGVGWEAVVELHGGPAAVELASRAAAWAAYAENAWAYNRHAAAATALEAECAVGVQGTPWAETVAHQSNLLRNLLGPQPFRPVNIEPFWLTWNNGTVVKLAQSIYEERELPSGTLDGGRLAVLADALEEAGAKDQDILQHLREQGGVHVRGCWVVDLLLGKE